MDTLYRIANYLYLKKGGKKLNDDKYQCRKYSKKNDNNVSSKYYLMSLIRAAYINNFFSFKIYSF